MCTFLDAKDARAAGFYQQYGFVPFSSNPLTLFLMLDDVEKTAATKL